MRYHLRALLCDLSVLTQLVVLMALKLFVSVLWLPICCLSHGLEMILECVEARLEMLEP